MELVIQSENLPTDAVNAFRAACLATGVRRRTNSARLDGIDPAAQTGTVVAALAKYWNCDAALLPQPLCFADFRVLVLDMDSTLITIECIDELAAYAGKGEAVAAITTAAMRGEIADYSESLRRRVALLAGAEESLLARVREERLRLSPGAAELIGAARKNGWSTLLVSGGFDYFAEGVCRSLGIDAYCANHLVARDGRLTGEVQGPEENDGGIVDAAAKARALLRCCAQAGCAAGNAIAVGDGANDLDMMRAAGLSIAYRAKPVVREHATHALQHTGLQGVLAIFSDGW